jgi:hypothetical protein
MRAADAQRYQNDKTQILRAVERLRFKPYAHHARI